MTREQRALVEALQRVAPEVAAQIADGRTLADPNLSQDTISLCALLGDIAKAAPVMRGLIAQQQLPPEGWAMLGELLDALVTLYVCVRPTTVVVVHDGTDHARALVEAAGAASRGMKGGNGSRGPAPCEELNGGATPHVR